jgi:hypothetical protein
MKLTTFEEEALKKFDEKFYHEETIDGFPCEFLVNNEDGKCNCQLKDIKSFLLKVLRNQRLMIVKEIWKLNRDTVGYMTLPSGWSKGLKLKGK